MDTLNTFTLTRNTIAPLAAAPPESSRTVSNVHCDQAWSSDSDSDCSCGCPYRHHCSCTPHLPKRYRLKNFPSEYVDSVFAVPSDMKITPESQGIASHRLISSTIKRSPVSYQPPSGPPSPQPVTEQAAQAIHNYAVLDPLDVKDLDALPKVSAITFEFLGDTPGILHPGVSKGAWSRMSLAERFQHGVFTPAFASCTVFYQCKFVPMEAQGVRLTSKRLDVDISATSPTFMQDICTYITPMAILPDVLVCSLRDALAMRTLAILPPCPIVIYAATALPSNHASTRTPLAIARMLNNLPAVEIHRDDTTTPILDIPINEQTASVPVTEQVLGMEAFADMTKLLRDAAPLLTKASSDIDRLVNTVAPNIATATDSFTQASTSATVFCNTVGPSFTNAADEVAASARASTDLMNGFSRVLSDYLSTPQIGWFKSKFPHILSMLWRLVRDIPDLLKSGISKSIQILGPYVADICGLFDVSPHVVMASMTAIAGVAGLSKLVSSTKDEDVIFHSDGSFTFRNKKHTSDSLRSALESDSEDEDIPDALSTQAGVTGTSPLFAVLSSLVGVSIFGALPTKCNFRQLQTVLSTFNSAVITAKHTEGLLSAIVSKLPDCVLGWLKLIVPENVVCPEYYAIDSPHQKVLADAEALYLSQSRLSPFQASSKRVELEQMHKRLLESGQILYAKQITGPLIMSTLNWCKQYREVIVELKLFSNDTGFKIVPAVLQIAGESNIGKSLLISHLVNMLCPDHIDPNMRVYTRNASDPYWSGYRGQLFVVIDDLGQDARPTASDPLEMFSMVSNAVFLPNMPSVDAKSMAGVKGQEFNSLCVLVASNQKWQKSPTVSDQQAYFRRMGYVIEAYIPDTAAFRKYRKADGTPDPDTFEPDFSHLRFRVFTAHTTNGSEQGSLLHEAKDLEWLCDFVHNHISTHLQRQYRVTRDVATGPLSVKRPIPTCPADLGAVPRNPDRPMPIPVARQYPFADVDEIVEVHEPDLTEQVGLSEFFANPVLALRKYLRERQYGVSFGENEAYFATVPEDTPLARVTTMFDYDEQLPNNPQRLNENSGEETSNLVTLLDGFSKHRTEDMIIAGSAAVERQLRRFCNNPGLDVDKQIRTSARMLKIDRVLGPVVTPTMRQKYHKFQTVIGLGSCRCVFPRCVACEGLPPMASPLMVAIHDQIASGPSYEIPSTDPLSWPILRALALVFQRKPRLLKVFARKIFEHLVRLRMAAPQRFDKRSPTYIEACIEESIRVHGPCFLVHFLETATEQQKDTIKLLYNLAPEVMANDSLRTRLDKAEKVRRDWFTAHPWARKFFIIASTVAGAVAAWGIIRLAFSWIFGPAKPDKLSLQMRGYSKSNDVKSARRNPLRPRETVATRLQEIAVQAEFLSELSEDRIREVCVKRGHSKKATNAFVELIDAIAGEAKELEEKLVAPVTDRRIPGVTDIVADLSNAATLDTALTKTRKAIAARCSKSDPVKEQALDVAIQDMIVTGLEMGDEYDRLVTEKALLDAGVDKDIASLLLDNYEPYRGALVQYLRLINGPDKIIALKEFAAVLHSALRNSPVYLATVTHKLTRLESVNGRLMIETNYQSPIALQAQASGDKQAQTIQENLYGKVGTLSYNWVEPSGDTMKWYISATPLTEHFLVVPYHFWIRGGKMITDGTELTFTVGAQQYAFPFSHKNVARLVTDGHTDITLYKDTTKRIPCARTIVHQYIKEEDIRLLPVFPAALVVATRIGINTAYVTATLAKSTRTVNREGEVKEVARCWNYSVVSHEGWCGGVLVSHQPGCDRKIVGHHWALSDSSSIGFACIATQEDWHRLLATFDETPEQLKGQGGVYPALPVSFDSKPPFEYSRPENSKVGVPQSPCIELFGCVPGTMAMHANTKTKIRQSPLYDRVRPHTTAPAILSLTDKRITNEMRSAFDLERGLLAIGLEKYRQPKPFPETTLKIVNDHMLERILYVTRDFPTCKVQDMNTAINGDVRLSPFITPINLDTSPGWKWRNHVLPGQRGKHALFLNVGTELEPVYVMRDPLHEAFVCKLERAKSGHGTCDSPWCGCCKDELRPEEKIAKPRIFIFPPIEFTLLFRMYMGDFVAAYRSAHNEDFWSAIGIDPHSIDWTILANRLIDNSPHMFDGDYSRWDGSMNAQLIYHFFDKADRWYQAGLPNAPSTWTPNDRLVRMVICEECIHTPVIANNLVIAIHGGNKSGNPATDLINSDGNHQLVELMYLEIMQREAERYASLAVFDRAIKDKNYGDDIVVSVHPTIVKYFNCVTFGKELAKYGIEFTAADKSILGAVAYKSIEEVTFLKNSFRSVHTAHGQQWWACMAKQTIYQLINYVKESPDPVAACEVNCNTALVFAFFHGEGFFKAVRNDILKAAHKIGMRVVLHSYEYFDQYYTKNRQMPPDEELEAQQIWATDSDYYPPLAVVAEQSAAVPLNPRPAAKGVRNQEEVHPSSNAKDSRAITTKGIAITDVDVTVVANNSRNGPDSSDISAGVQNWTIKDMTGRYSFVRNLVWLTSYEATRTLTERPLTVPRDFIVAAMAKVGFAYFLNFRGDLKIRISLEGTPFHSGTLWVYFIPHATYEMERICSTFHDKRYAMHHYGAFLDASASSSVELTIPFAHFRDFITFSDDSALSIPYNSLGSVQFMVYNRLECAAGASDQLPLSVYAALDDARFIMPSGKTTYPAPTPPPIRVVEQAGAFLAASAVSAIVNKVMPEEVHGDAVQHSGTKMDAPAVTVTPAYVIPKQMGFLNNAVQLNPLERLSLYPGSLTLPLPDTFGTTQDVTDLKWLCSRPTPLGGDLGEFSWTDSDQSGKVLWQAPMTVYGEVIDIWKFGDNKYISQLGYFSSMFKEWRGKIRFTFQFVTNAFTTGKIWIGLHYGYHRAPIEREMDLAQSQLGAAVELTSGQRVWTIECDYNSLTKYLHVPHGRLEEANDFTRISMGQISVRVLNRLVGPPNVPKTCRINVYISAADLQLAHPTWQNQTAIPIRIQSGSELAGEEVVNAAVVTEDAVVESSGKPISLAVGKPASKTDRGFMDHTTTNLMDILKKYTRCAYIKLAPFEGQADPDDVRAVSLAMMPLRNAAIMNRVSYADAGVGYPMLPALVTNQSAAWRKIASCYRWRRGTLRFKAIISNLFTDPTGTGGKIRPFVAYYPNWSLPYGLPAWRVMWDRLASAIPAPNYAGNDRLDWQNWTEAPINDCFQIYEPNDQGVFEFEVPYESIYNFLLNDNRDLPNEANPVNTFGKFSQALHLDHGMLFFGALATQVEPAAAPYIALQLWIAAGEDFHFGGYVGVPPIQRMFYRITQSEDNKVWPDNYNDDA